MQPCDMRRGHRPIRRNEDTNPLRKVRGLKFVPFEQATNLFLMARHKHRITQRLQSTHTTIALQYDIPRIIRLRGSRDDDQNFIIKITISNNQLSSTKNIL